MKTTLFLACLVSSAALAQVDAVPPASPPVDASLFAAPSSVDDDPTEQTNEGPFAWGRRANFGGALGEVKAGAGGGDFTQGRAQAVTGAATSWDVRGVFGGHSPLGIEGAYTGSTRTFDNGVAGVGPFDNTFLVANGVEGDVRLGLPVRASATVDVRPFAFGGVGWQYMTLWGDGPVQGDRGPGDHILTVPAGVGLELGIGVLNVEARGTYRHAVGSDLLGDATADFDDPRALHSYNIGAAIGVEL